MDSELIEIQKYTDISAENESLPIPSLEPGTDDVVESTEDALIEEDEAIEPEESSPFIPQEIYEMLPEVLKTGSQAFRTRREKDVFLISTITLLSGCFPTVYGIYDRKKVNANLFTFIIAPAASGKSALIAGRELVQPIHNDLHNH